MSGDIDVDQLSDVMTRLGEAVVDPAAWTDIMTSICEAVGATAAVLLQADVRTPDVPRTAAIDEAVQLYFAQNWHLQDPRARGVPRAMSGEIITDQQLLTPEELRSDPMYNEVLYRYGFKWFAGIGFWADTAPWVLTLQRTGQEGLFETRETRLLAQLAPRLTETATLSTVVGRVALTSMTGILDRVQQPAIVLDRAGLAIDRNTAADAGFDEDIRVRDRRLVLRDKAAMARFDAVIDRIRNAPEHAALPVEPILIRRATKGPVVMRVLPIDGAARNVFLGARAMLVLSNLTPRALPEPALIAQAFGLTPAEARLVALLAGGLSITDAADRLGIVRDTARNQLKSVFAKTGTHRQPELVGLVLQIA
ncbi:helix-turn-helix transcriptional regulator [Bradyrhizobium jicamae]|uniref:helix-turn-helix transcriptional regulator n=1 Tax=Bradyrhizobium jicamae TaxID=280332 RepID=UPI001BABC456|nr:helix-turn-helix transcriptional regulator [Bradyrhizobium jicamae]MBR0754695.1 helix-turn-helix transcriptional regulator [Bradyrhizobium jicamae]